MDNEEKYKFFKPKRLLRIIIFTYIIFSIGIIFWYINKLDFIITINTFLATIAACYLFISSFTSINKKNMILSILLIIIFGFLCCGLLWVSIKATFNYYELNRNNCETNKGICSVEIPQTNSKWIYMNSLSKSCKLEYTEEYDCYIDINNI